MSSYLERLEGEKDLIEKQIAELKNQAMQINLLLLREKARTAAADNNEIVNRKNINRIYAETTILEGIKLSKSGLKTSEIINYVHAINTRINPSTIRTYVARMRDKGLIKKQNNGKWRLVEIQTNLFAESEGQL